MGCSNLRERHLRNVNRFMCVHKCLNAKVAHISAISKLRFRTLCGKALNSRLLFKSDFNVLTFI